MRKLILPVIGLAFILTSSCGGDNCSCIKRTYEYPDDSYPTYTEEEVDCPADITEDKPVIQFYPAPDNKVIEYMILMECDY